MHNVEAQLSPNQSQPLVTKPEKVECNKTWCSCTFVPPAAALTVFSMGQVLTNDPNDCASCSPILQAFVGVFLLSLSLGSLIFNTYICRGISTENLDQKEKQKLQCMLLCPTITSVATVIFSIVAIVTYAENCNKLGSACNY